VIETLRVVLFLHMAFYMRARNETENSGSRIDYKIDRSPVSDAGQDR